METHSELVQKRITIAMATDPPNKSRKCRNQKQHGTYEHLITTTHLEPGTEKDLRWLWPLTHKTNSEC